MVLPRPALVNQLEMVASAEGKRLSYLLVDHSTGMILRLSEQAAKAFSVLRAATLGDKSARETMTEEDAQLGFAVLNAVKSSRPKGRKPFNPLFAQIELIELPPIQRRIEAVAKIVFSGWMLALIALFLVVAIVVGAGNGFAIGIVFQNALSLKVLATIVFIAPVLRLIHETGHLLAATRFGIRGRMGGVFLIGLYPMPFVDFTDADIEATRHQRMLISAAGILTDLTIGLVAFFVWHLSEVQTARDIAGYVFVVSTVSSVLFNLNPLIRMDGYHVLADALGRRNLATDGQLILRNALSFLMSGGNAGVLPGSGEKWSYLLFAIASFLYRVTVLFSIIFGILPRFFGLGSLLAIWGAIAMFGPLLRARDPNHTRQGATGRQKSIFWGAIGVGVALLMFLPVAPRALVQLKPEVIGNYTVTSQSDGVMHAYLQGSDVTAAGDNVVQLSNAAIDRSIEMASLAVEEGEVIRQVALGTGALEITAAEDRLIKAKELRSIGVRQRDHLTIQAPISGDFTPYALIHEGRRLPAGTVLGQVLPSAGKLQFVGHFPETKVEAFENGIVSAELLSGSGFHILDPQQVELIETVSVDAENLDRGFSIRVLADSETRFPQVLLRFHPIPVWMHARGWANRKIAALREAQIADIINKIES